ncbi:OLC1v1024385C1 [Oldenlandia corymbosa var. corymbosa]|uniref:OLC1v1024385C1 n=1 Tax=Oldenlandia corymbosa var. corymbosa TaxID=529605 RepID=A0AAV1C3Z7_OLDCO|nr:OLC1v1024385C1 [Oldenlandia corymbosa var. corymbosa]
MLFPCIKLLVISIFTASVFPPFALLTKPESSAPMLPSFAFSWYYNNDKFAAGDVVSIKVKVLGRFDSSKFKHPFDPNITINNRVGNSSYISGVSSFFDDDFNTWRISFIPIMAGSFNVLITDENFNVLDSSLHFHVIPGKMYPGAGIVSWMGGVNEFVAGDIATILILPRDAFGNNISSEAEKTNFDDFSVSSTTLNGSVVSTLNIKDKGWTNFGYLRFEFVVATSGNLLLQVQVQNQSLIGVPMPFRVIPGALDVANCSVSWHSETKSFQLFSMMEGFIHQHDQYGNLVPGIYEFDVEVVEKGTNLSMPVSDLVFEEVSHGIQLFTFSLMEPGNFTLLILDKQQNILISNVPYDFNVYIGYCHGINSVVNGSGLNNSVAGEVASFAVFLRDAYQYPSPVELERLQVKIWHEMTLQQLQATVSPQKAVNGTYHDGIFLTSTPPPIVHAKNKSNENAGFRTSAFEVTFVPEKSGIHEITIFCGNIALNDGHPFRMESRAGKVNLSLSGIANITQKVAKLTKNELLVHLMDSHYNPIMAQQSKLKLEMASLNRSGFRTTMFVDNNDGSYSCSYLAKDVGTFEICASFDGKHFMPCPIGVNVYTREYFPQVFNDTVTVWEDESTAFDALENDYFAGGNATVLEYSAPHYGSLLQYGRLFRYTPYKGFYGNDSFLYTISDLNGNHASGLVNIAILSVPPQLSLFPSQLQGTEDLVSPRYGGFSGFELAYSDLTENITVILNAKHGTVFLSPLIMQFWQSPGCELIVSRENQDSGELSIHGCLEVINSALQAIQYSGTENFYGEDSIEISTMNRNGMNNVKVPIFVDPINDPPFVSAPPFIFLQDSGDDQVLIYDRKRDKFDFVVGDPDLLNYPGNRSHFLVMFSLEVSSGYISTSLPVDLISTTELKFKTSYQWQPLVTFVTISKHFLVKAKGIRFRGTIDECNSIMEQLMYSGDKHGDVLTVKVNDMGSYGCYPNCDQMTSMPLFAEATINLIRRQPMSSLLAHTLGSAVVVEFIALLFLGVVLVYFTCRCAVVLMREKRKNEIQNIELTQVGTSDKQAHNLLDSSEGLSWITAPFNDCCSTRFFSGRGQALSPGSHSPTRTRESSEQNMQRPSLQLQQLSSDDEFVVSASSEDATA